MTHSQKCFRDPIKNWVEEKALKTPLEGNVNIKVDLNYVPSVESVDL
jgi:Holliday junction resolvase RusA-like endonuclease